MADQSTWEIQLTNGKTELVYGEAIVRNGVLTIVERYGLSLGIKRETHYPLTSVLSWKVAER